MLSTVFQRGLSINRIDFFQTLFDIATVPRYAFKRISCVFYKKNQIWQTCKETERKKLYYVINVVKKSELLLKHSMFCMWQIICLFAICETLKMHWPRPNPRLKFNQMIPIPPKKKRATNCNSNAKSALLTACVNSAENVCIVQMTNFGCVIQMVIRCRAPFSLFCWLPFFSVNIWQRFNSV